MTTGDQNVASGQTVPAAGDTEGHGTVPYDHRSIERRWQAAWLQADLHRTPPLSGEDDRSAYVVAEHPVPSYSASFDLVRNYALGDACARFMRARGAGVLFSLAFQSFGVPVELEAIANDTTPAEWVERCTGRLRDQLRRLGVSLDWSRVSDTSDPAVYRWSQLLFLALMEKGLIRSANGEWHLRIGGYANENVERLSQLPDWNPLALTSQQVTQGCVDGVELDVASLDGSSITVFTMYPDAIKQAEFVAISPNHPEIGNWITPEELQERIAAAASSDAEESEAGLVATDTGRLVMGAGTPNPIPVIVSPVVDLRFGPTAVLGVPSADKADSALFEFVDLRGASSAWKATDRGPSSVRPAQRYTGEGSIRISAHRAWGAPIPVVHCKACGAVPVPAEDLPVKLPENMRTTKGSNPLEQDEEFFSVSCPRCSGQGRRDTDTIDPAFDALWEWLAPCVEHAEANNPFEGSESSRWLPVVRAVRTAEHGELIFNQRMGAKALRDSGLLADLIDGEPFAGMTLHERVQKVRLKERNSVDGLIKRVGADALRMTMVYGAAPSTVLPWHDHALQYCRNWLGRLWDYALPRVNVLKDLSEIDSSAGAIALRARMQRWSRTAIQRITENYDAVEPHRAARNVMTLLARVEDFEQRVVSRQGELTPADQYALGQALLVAIQLIAPITPHIAQELWAASGREDFVIASWPELDPATEAA